jgi:hypothetical protein
MYGEADHFTLVRACMHGSREERKAEAIQINFLNPVRNIHNLDAKTSRPEISRAMLGNSARLTFPCCVEDANRFHDH